MDSIQRQLNRNINLLNNRLKKIGREIRFSGFSASNQKKILSKLYGYRSRIAHGGEAKESLDNLTKIRAGNERVDKLWVHDWMRDMVKLLLLASIIEPDLVMDLK
ncbi:MAG: hypothetical protein COB51_04765 [Moraxellaceae bacterium]|nr:MAG: hypothetical protein COB51_04765 [Moraxellaceae bacterium]